VTYAGLLPPDASWWDLLIAVIAAVAGWFGRVTVEFRRNGRKRRGG